MALQSEWPEALIEDPAISKHGNISFNTEVEADAASGSTSGLREKYSQASNNRRYSETNLHFDNRKLLARESIETRISPSMQHLVGRQIRTDHFPPLSNDSFSSAFIDPGSPYYSPTYNGGHAKSLNSQFARHQQSGLRYGNREQLLTGTTVGNSLDTSGNYSGKFSDDSDVYEDYDNLRGKLRNPFDPTNLAALAARMKQDQVLDQNLAYAAKNVYELTDGGSRPSSRASSNECTPEADKKPRPESSTPTYLRENPPHRRNIDSGVELNQKLNGGSQHGQSNFNDSGFSQNVSPTVLNDTNLSSQLSQLNLNSSVHNDTDKMQMALSLINMMSKNPELSAVLSRLVQMSNETSSSKDWNQFNFNQHLTPGPTPSSGNSVSLNQLSAVLANLSKTNPALLERLESGAADVQQVATRVYGSKTIPSGSLNPSLLSYIGGLIPAEALMTDSELMDALVAFAARVDSKNINLHGFNPPSNFPMRQNLRHSASFGSEPTFSPLCYRNYSSSISTPTGKFGSRQINPEGDIDRAATMYRNSANNASKKLETIHRWNGELPVRNYCSMSFSKKVFLGGVPWECSEADLKNTFSQFGNVSVIWPQKDGGYASNHNNNETGSERSSSNTPKGYCYLLFEHESCVSDLLTRCTRDPTHGGEYFKLSSSKSKGKGVQVIPWVLSDSTYDCGGGGGSKQPQDKTVFVGALHGMITAEALASIMTELFGPVAYAALDTDKHKYPIGSGRVVFRDQASFFRAVTANFVEVRTKKFTKTIQIDPFLEDSMCEMCRNMPGVYFCRALECFKYFCPTCWQKRHSSHQVNHKPLRRSLKANSERA